MTYSYWCGYTIPTYLGRLAGKHDWSPPLDRSCKAPPTTELRTMKGRCVVVGSDRLEDMRVVCRDDLLHAYRDVWHMWCPDSAG